MIRSNQIEPVQCSLATGYGKLGFWGRCPESSEFWVGGAVQRSK